MEWRIQKFTFLTLIVNGEGEEEWPVLVMHLRITEMVVSYSLKDEELKNLDLSFLTEI